MDSPINTKLISHPMNWVVVFLMLVIAGTAGHFLASLMGFEPDTKVNANLAVGQSNIGKQS